MRKKTESRRLSFVTSAGKLFVEQGFGSVTMEAIAAEAGASKVTLYSYFPNKEELFQAFLYEAGKGAIDELNTVTVTNDIRLTLHHLGMAYLNLVTRPDVINVSRLIIGEASRYPELSRIFYENAAKQTLIHICDVMESLMSKGLIRRNEIRQTGLYFKSLCEAGLVERQLWGVDPEPDEETKKRAVADAIEAFLMVYTLS